jgi:serine/threonine protein kinase
MDALSHPVACALDSAAHDVLQLPVVCPLTPRERWGVPRMERRDDCLDAADPNNRPPASAALVASGGSSAELLPLTHSQLMEVRDGRPSRDFAATFADVVVGRASGGGGGHRSAQLHHHHHRFSPGSPAVRASTALITQAAAHVPPISPATMWITISDDDDDDDGNKNSTTKDQSMSESRIDVDDEDAEDAEGMPLAGTSASSRGGEEEVVVLRHHHTLRSGSVEHQRLQQTQQAPIHHHAVSSFALPQTFRPRKGASSAPGVSPTPTTQPLGPQKSGGGSHQRHSGKMISLVDSSDSDESVVRRAGDRDGRLPCSSASPAPPLVMRPAVAVIGPPRVASTAAASSILTPAPRPMVTDPSSTGAANRKRARIEEDAQRRGSHVEQGGSCSSPLFGRPVDVLRPLYPTVQFTKRLFMTAVNSVVSKEFSLKRNEFWSAFKNIAYVGEGSFGIVWRCTTLEGNVVAVKSCPISFQSPAHIDDGFSVLREIAIMRFLNEQQVPYVLPLRGAFFVESNEALPPKVMKLLQQKPRSTRARGGGKAGGKDQKKGLKKQNVKMKEVSAAARKKTSAVNNIKNDKKKQAQSKKAKGKKQPLPKKKGCPKKPSNSSSDDSEDDDVTRSISSESDDSSSSCCSSSEEEEEAEVRLPKFLAIAQTDALSSHATLFLVTELCDGDVESIPERAETVTRGVAFCVSSAVTDLHRLGLVHLDIKPSNILFAYEKTEICASSTGAALPTGVMNVTPLRPPRAFSSSGGGGGHAIRFYLSDFGNCQIVGPAYSDVVHDAIGTYEYMDAEALEFKICSRATDCFSLGCTIHELLTGSRLFADCSKKACRGSHSRLCYVAQAKAAAALQRSSTADGAARSGGSLMARVAGWLCNADATSRLSAAGCKNYLINALGVSPSVVPPSPLPGGLAVLTAVAASNHTSAFLGGASSNFSTQKFACEGGKDAASVALPPLGAVSPTSLRLRFLSVAAALNGS